MLDAAARLFAADGYHATSLARIANAAQITAPSLLHYFPNKEALFDEVLRVAWTSLADELRPMLDDEADPAAMVGHVLGTVSAAESDGLLTAITAALFSGPGLGARAINDTLLPLMDELDERLRAATAGAIHPDAPVRETLIYLAIGHAAQHQFGLVAPEAARATAGEEPSIAITLLQTLLAWTPESTVLVSPRGTISS